MAYDHTSAISGDTRSEVEKVEIGTEFQVFCELHILHCILVENGRDVFEVDNALCVRDYARYERPEHPGRGHCHSQGIVGDILAHGEGRRVHMAGALW